MNNLIQEVEILATESDRQLRVFNDLMAGGEVPPCDEGKIWPDEDIKDIQRIDNPKGGIR